MVTGSRQNGLPLTMHRAWQMRMFPFSPRSFYGSHHVGRAPQFYAANLLVLHPSLSEEESDDEDDDIDLDPENEGSEYECSLYQDDASSDKNAGPNNTVDEVWKLGTQRMKLTTVQP